MSNIEKEIKSAADLAIRVDEAIDLAVKYGGIDGAHHKDWVIDQMVRTLAGKHYDAVVKDACDGEDGPNTYNWSTGTSP